VALFVQFRAYGSVSSSYLPADEQGNYKANIFFVDGFFDGNNEKDCVREKDILQIPG